MAIKANKINVYISSKNITISGDSGGSGGSGGSYVWFKKGSNGSYGSGAQATNVPIDYITSEEDV